ncbi:N-acetylmuramoyl-L-alanine amidase [Emcibacter nanhaiensis]|uniref:N-acetylmuramoyl-L-alanine amidase n=1 Tax=Emcibacter nanhaiensis TaxID=1505037 RepID=A0A501PCA7_9PROT|nr:N-acetylmuramoyl-L-alanine amidase [Emcibacter nanhaiensis]TPD57637.1 N-acetylmuramoyl-L-alanine amidase [Emcibacter nanhaiensis]
MTFREIIDSPSPNFDERRAEVRYLILHYTGMATGQEALDRLRDPEAKVSAHYLIEENGTIHQLVPEEKRAWHAGVSSWEDESDINSLSVGIELVNPGHDYPGYKGDYRPFPPAQMDSLLELSKAIVERNHILPWHVLGHSDVAPARKVDPGELFDWRWLAERGVGAWPAKAAGEMDPSPVHIRRMLKDYGYGFSGEDDAELRVVLSAFQRHFRPENFSGAPDPESAALLQALLDEKGKQAI